MDRYYFYDDKKLIVYHGTDFADFDPSLIYLGTSDNENWAMAAAVFIKDMKIKSGYRLVRLD
jgi:hypothetical protein